MTDFVLKLFGIDATGAANLSNLSLEFHGVNPAWVLLAAALLGLLVVWMYRRSGEHVPALRRYGLAALRVTFLALLLVMLLQPVLTVSFEHMIRRTLLVLVDASSSMSKIPDQRTDPDDLKRVAIARGVLDPAKGLDQPVPALAPGIANEPRIDVARAALKNPRLALLPRLAARYDIDAYEFDRTLKPIPGASYVQPPEARAGGRRFLLAYPWFVPALIIGLGIFCLVLGAVARAPLARNLGLGAMLLGVLWGGLAWYLSREPVATAATTRPAPDAVQADVDPRWIDHVQANGSYTAVGDAVRAVISRKRGQPIAGVLLVTDGVSNVGVQPASAAAMAGQDRVPIYPYGVGITSPKDIIVAPELIAQDVAFARDEVPVSVRVQGRGMAGKTASLSVSLGEEKTEKTITFNGDGEQIVTVSLTPKKEGNFTIRASIPALDAEVVKTNNSASRPIRVIDGKIKVLYVEQYPRWEFKYIQAILMRDRRVDLKCILIEGDPGIVAGKDSPYLREFPVRKQELFKYDLVIIGDVDPKYFSPTQLDALGEFVSRFGGSVAMIAGKRYAPDAYRRTIIEKMLPVEIESETSLSLHASRPIQPELTAAGRSSLTLRLAPSELESLQRWQQLPPIYWENRVTRAKPAATVLLVDPDPARASRYGKMPILAMQQYGLGQFLYVGTDNFWRWRKNAGDKYHAMFWGQMTQRLALPHLLGASKRTHLSSDARRYYTGDPVTIYARLYTEGFEPMSDPVIKAGYWQAGSTAPPRELQLKALPDQPGVYRGVLLAPEQGSYKLAVDHDKSVTLDFEVVDPDRELVEPAMDRAALQQMATASGGVFSREEDLETLPEKIAARVERKLTTREKSIVYSWAYFILLLSVVSAEWILRKASQLK